MSGTGLLKSPHDEAGTGAGVIHAHEKSKNFPLPSCGKFEFQSQILAFASDSKIIFERKAPPLGMPESKVTTILLCH